MIQIKKISDIKLSFIIEKFRPFMKKLISNSEGRIFLMGLGISLMYVFGLAITWFFSPGKFQTLLGITAMHVLFGRAAALSFGYTMGLGQSVVIPVSMIIETILVTISYPLFVFSMQRLLVIESLSSFMDKIRNAAERNKGKMKKYGRIGLFFFVWFPFWMTGPVVGSIIGFFLGLKHWVVISIVLGGTYMAITVWAIFLKELHDLVAAFNPYVPFMMLAGIVVVVIIGNVLYDVRSKNGKKKT